MTQGEKSGPPSAKPQTDIYPSLKTMMAPLSMYNEVILKPHCAPHLLL